MRAFEVHFIGGPFDGGHCLLSTAPPDVLYLPIKPHLPATVPLYSLTVAACSGVFVVSEYELDLTAARRRPETCIVLNYRLRRLLAAWRTAPRPPSRENVACDERDEIDRSFDRVTAATEPAPGSQPPRNAPRWRQFQRLVARRLARLKAWFTAPVAHPLFVPTEAR